MKTNESKIDEILSRGVEEVYVHESIVRRLNSGNKLRIKYGIDPTGPDIHLGRASTLWKLREFQDLGHRIILIIGDYTAQIGDPSDKLSKRPFLTREQVENNMRLYREQLSKILDIRKVDVRFNSKWIGKLEPREMDELAELFSVQQMLARRNFKERWEKGEEISLREMHYPLYQGYDSVVVKADIEIGGFDQLFNLLAGRKIQEAFGQEPQDVLTAKMLLGADGRKMSTSWGNVINISEEPNEMYGKIMTIVDELIIDYFTLCTRLPMEQVRDLEKRLREGENPRDLKMILAYEIVKLYHGERAAQAAQENFVQVFQKKEAPEEIPVKKVRSVVLFEILVETGLAESKSEARRLIEQGGIKVQGEVVRDPYFSPNITDKGVLIQKGKRFFVKIVS